MILFLILFAVAFTVTFFIAKVLVKILNKYDFSKKMWFKVAISIIVFILNYYILIGGLFSLMTIYPDSENILNKINFELVMLAILLATTTGTYLTYKGLGSA